MKKNNRSDKARKSVNRHEMGISWRLFGVLLIFIAFILAVIWIFQVVLLNTFYKQSKMQEFSVTDSALSEKLGDEEMLNVAANFYASEYDECIRVFCIQDNQAHEMVNNVCATKACLIHNISDEILRTYINKAIESENHIYVEHLKHPQSSDDHASSRALGTVYVSVREMHGRLYVIMLNSEHLPLSATVNTLEMQFSWIAFVLLIAALIVAIMLSRSLCKPLKEMGEAAEKLARGNYDANFKGGSYREAQELADALNYAAEELSKVDNLQKELVANISHDLRTPLTMIKGYGEIMRDIPDENTPENIQVIIDETERLTELVNDMLDISKIRSGARKPEIEEFNLTQTVKEVMARYVKLTEHDGYNITFDFEREIYVRADRTMILQVVYNLINNAINYTGSDKYVRVVQSQRGNTVRISVSDTGEGIKKEDMPYIWDRYYKVDKVHKRARVGTGLGLSIVKGVLEAHGAVYGLNSKVGKGTTFWFELNVEKCELISLE